MPDFKVGDRVRATSDIVTHREPNIKNGDVGTVLTEGCNLLVEFDKNIGGHNGNNFSPNCKDGHGWYIFSHLLEKITDTPSGLKVDDSARAKIVQELRNKRNQYQQSFDRHINKITKAATVEDIMAAKMDLLADIVKKMPIGDASCYFCAIANHSCNNCEYSKHHNGTCGNNSSDFDKISRARDGLMSAINNYYKGEKYADNSELETGDVVVVADVSYHYAVKDGKLYQTDIHASSGKKFRIVQTGLILPTAHFRLNPERAGKNDTIIQEIESGEVAFIQKRFLQLAE